MITTTSLIVSLIAIIFCTYAFYIEPAIILNRLYYYQEGKKTILGWIPFANIYLLGRVAINNTAGWVLVVLYLISIATRISSLIGIYSLAFLILLFYDCHKYSKLHKKYKNGELKINDQTNMQQSINNMPQNNMQQPVNNQMSGQQTQQVNNFCPTCGTQIAPGTAFCQNCGSKIS